MGAVNHNRLISGRNPGETEQPHDHQEYSGANPGNVIRNVEVHVFQDDYGEKNQAEPEQEVPIKLAIKRDFHAWLPPLMGGLYPARTEPGRGLKHTARFSYMVALPFVFNNQGSP